MIKNSKQQKSHDQTSYLKDLNVYGNTTLTKLLFNEFINGHQRDLNNEEEAFIEKVISTIHDYQNVKVVLTPSVDLSRPKFPGRIDS